MVLKGLEGTSAEHRVAHPQALWERKTVNMNIFASFNRESNELKWEVGVGEWCACELKEVVVTLWRVWEICVYLML